MSEYILNVQFSCLIFGDDINKETVESVKTKKAIDNNLDCCFKTENHYWNDVTETIWCKSCEKDTLIPF